MSPTIFGIDLGTTNSAIARARDGAVEVIELDGGVLLPSVVGVDPAGKLLVGVAARNQLAAYPERTVASIKRAMGRTERHRIGALELTPEEISAHILRELARGAEQATGEKVERVVITVPAFFRDVQRQATRTAGEIAGLDVVRIVNEPTAAALAFGGAGEGERCLLVYDLGGGTFDVSVVRTDGELIEVLASHGDVHLGGDDFDALIAEALARELRDAGRGDPRGDPVAEARLRWAAEAAKRRLTEDVVTPIREEFLAEQAGKAIHLETELERGCFEEMVAPLLERSLDSVHEALAAAGRSLADIDDVLLVGGSTRSPVVGRRLEQLLGRPPRRDVHPDLCVALGAAVLGARLAGQAQSRVLVDVTPYSFGPSYLGEADGRLSAWCFAPVIERGTPLPVTRSETYYTAIDGQEAWDVRVFQGESPDARDNVLVGHFTAEGFAAVPAGNPIVCKMTLDLDGILTVEVIERSTGLSKSVTIEGVTTWSDEQIAQARQRAAALWGEEVEPEIPRVEPAEIDVSVLARGRALRRSMAEEDRAEFDDLVEELEDARKRADDGAARAILGELEDLVHYVEEAS